MDSCDYYIISFVFKLVDVGQEKCVFLSLMNEEYMSIIQFIISFYL